MPKNGSEWKLRRMPYEFTKETIYAGLVRSSYLNKERSFCCERCLKTKKEVGYLEAHHRLGIYFAIHFFPEVSVNLIKSLANLEILCPDCHKKEHSVFRKSEAKIIAQALLGLSGAGTYK